MNLNGMYRVTCLEAVVRGYSVKVVRECSQNSQENTCARVFFLIKLQVSGLQLYEKESGIGVFQWI